jgi:hypothetical protein
VQINTIFCETSPHVSASRHHHGIVLFDTTHGQLFTANEAGADIWLGLEQRLPAERIAEQLSLRYSIPLESARSHTNRFIGQLADQRLVERRPA